MSKNTTEAAKDFPVSFLKKYGYLRPSYVSGTIRWTWHGEPSGSVGISVEATNMSVRCRYTQTSWDGEKEDYDYYIRLTKTPCYFGGYRYWFICPLVVSGVPCRRRVGVLYLEGKWFGCRNCYALAYDTQKESHTSKWSHFGRVLTLESKLEEEWNAMRVKYWKGRPTKRYRKWLAKNQHFENITPSLLALHQREMDKMQARFPKEDDVE